MRKILLILLALCIAAPAMGQDFVYFKKKAAGTPAGYQCTDDAATGAIFQERFECGSTDGNEEHSWTQVTGDGTHNMDYTTTVLQGTEWLIQTFNTTGEEWSATWTHTDGSALWIAFKFRIPEGNTTRYLARFNEGGSVGYLRLIWATDHWTVRLGYNGGAATANGSTYLSAATDYYVKVEYQRGTGANAVYDLWTSTDGSTWTHEITRITDATINAVDFQVFSTYVTAGSIIYDDIRVDNADINY